MTKFMWFQIISIFLIFGILVAVCVIEDKLVTTALERVDSYCYEIENAIKENDGIGNNEVNSLVLNLEYNWLEDESKLCFLVNHKSIQEIGVEISKLASYIEQNDIKEFTVSLNLIKLHCDQYFHFMGASFYNIL